MRGNRKHDKPALPPRLDERPIIAILGRPNVGKSTLFNRMVGRRASIVEDKPGVTRDRLYANTEIEGRPVTLMDMGGFEYSPEGTIEEGVSKQCLAGLEQAHLVLFVVDGRVPPTNGDHETVQLLRRSGRPAILVINKVDGPRLANEAGDAFGLGLEPVVMVSALHGRGMADLEDLMVERLPEPPPYDPEEETKAEESEDLLCRISIIGRPNAGKSSIINKLLGEERLLTLDEPGTTRDPVDTLVERKGKQYVLIDTAGIRRKRSMEKMGAEKLSVMGALESIERSHVVVVLIDADQGVAEQDAKILGLAVEKHRAVVVGLNKWDLVRRDEDKKAKLKERTRDILSFIPWARIVQVSALTGSGLDKLMVAVDDAFAQFNQRVSTGELNRLFEDIIAHHPPAMRKGKSVRLYYATQASVRPPTFVVYTNYPDLMHFSYQRYIQNRLREAFGFEGTPLRLLLRGKKKREP
jgi:GTP-binding protein